MSTMSQKTKIKIAIALGIVTLTLGFIALIVIAEPGGSSAAVASGGGDSDSFPWVIFIPIFAGGTLPAIMAAQKKKEEEAKSKRLPEGMDMYSMIDRVVDDLGDDEMDYLEQRVDEVYGSEYSDGEF